MILCLGAHPDDIELGAGATLSTMTDKVGYCFTLESAFMNMFQEIKDAWTLLDIKYIPKSAIDFEHRNLNRQKVLDKLIQLREQLNPSIVFTHSSFDTHQDHKVIHEETIRAFKGSTILGYSLPWNDVTGSDYRYFKKLSLEAVETKLKALECYESQSHRSYFNREYQISQLVANGQLVNTQYAEKFELIRYVDSTDSI